MSDAKSLEMVSLEGPRGEKCLLDNKSQHFAEQYSKVSQFKQIPKNYRDSDQDSIINPSRLNSQNETNVFPKTDSKLFAQPTKQSNPGFSIINYSNVNHTSNSYLHCNGNFPNNFTKVNLTNPTRIQNFKINKDELLNQCSSQNDQNFGKNMKFNDSPVFHLEREDSMPLNNTNYSANNRLFQDDLMRFELENIMINNNSNDTFQNGYFNSTFPNPPTRYHTDNLDLNQNIIKQNIQIQNKKKIGGFAFPHNEFGNSNEGNQKVVNNSLGKRDNCDFQNSKSSVVLESKGTASQNEVKRVSKKKWSEITKKPKNMYNDNYKTKKVLEHIRDLKNSESYLNKLCLEQQEIEHQKDMVKNRIKHLKLNIQQIQQSVFFGNQGLNYLDQNNYEKPTNIILNFELNIDQNKENFLQFKENESENIQYNSANASQNNSNQNKRINQSVYGKSESVTNSKRVPLINGNINNYVLIKFNREKKREAFKYCQPIEKLFPNLQLVFKKILWNQQIYQAELDALNKGERQIIKSILIKKRLISSKEGVDFTQEKFELIISRNGIKRNEENLKCVFKYALKFLRTQFRKNNSEFKFRRQNIKMKQKNLIDLGFYTSYFGEIADNLDWPISKFFHPKVFTGNPSLNKNLDEPEMRPKTINKEYIDNLKRSDMFICDLKNYLENKFEVSPGKYTGIIDQYKQVSNEKMLQKLNSWKKTFKKGGEEEGLKIVLKDLNANDKCKLPWSVTEMQKAVDDTKNHFEMNTLS